MSKLAGPGLKLERPEGAGLETECGLTSRHSAAGTLADLRGALLILSLQIVLATSPSRAQEQGEIPASTPEVYVNTELLERLATEGTAARPSAEETPQSLLQTPPSWQLESRLYVVPLGRAQPAEPALAPPVPSVLTSELKAQEGGRAAPARKRPSVVMPREAPPRSPKVVVAPDSGDKAPARAAGSQGEAFGEQAAAPVPAPPAASSEADIPAAAPPQLTADLGVRGEDAASGASGPETPAPGSQAGAGSPPPRQALDKTEIPTAAPPRLTTELQGLGEDAASGASGPQNLVPEPPDAAPPALPPQGPGTIEIPAMSPSPAATASPDPEPETPADATGADAPPPAAQILDELAEAAEREAPRTRTVVAPPVPEPPPPLDPDAIPSDETTAADELATAAPPAPDPEEQLGPVPAPLTTKDAGRQIAARPPAKASPEGRILFEAGSTELSPEARGVLEGLAERLKAADAEGVELRAYATGRDSRRLSLSRGLVARGYLEKLGVDPDTVFLRPLGDTATAGPSERIDFELLAP